MEDLMDQRRNRVNPYASEIKAIENQPGASSIVAKLPSKAETASTTTSCFVIPSGWGVESGGPGSKFDLALIFTKKNQSSSMTLPLYKGSLAINTIGTMIGYGWDKNMESDAHIKRAGTNRISEISKDGVIYLDTPSVGAAPTATTVSVREGDSGGPLLIDGKVAGVASALLYSGNRTVTDSAGNAKTQKVDIGYYVDLNHPFVQEFIQKSLSDFASGKIDPDSRTPCTPILRSDYLKSLQGTK
jgi:hypothetical protein